MGTKEHQTALQAASNAVTSPTEVSKTSATNSTVGAANKQNSTHTSDTSKSSNRSNVAKSTTQISSHAANTNYHTTKTATTTTTTATTPHHSKAQVIIIPATPASTVATNAAKKIRRAFSMPRNPFQWSRKFKTSGGGGSNETPDSGDGGGGSGGNSALTACVGGRRSGRHGSIVSLNSYTAVCKDTDVGAADTSTTAATSQRQEKKNSNTPGSNAGGANRVFRRSSLRKFINRIAQHVSTSVNIGTTDKSAFAGIVPFYTGCWRRKEANKHVSSQTNSLSSTDRVPPIGGYQWPADQTPGVTGLKNHGNTCFMNAVLQCLSHTDILAEYFVLDQYKSDLKRRNKINSRKFGTKGELTEQLANVLKALWTCKNESDHSTSFKAVVDRYGSQFRSSTQHDAQEFLFWLLDKVHEDLNTATKRRYKSVKNSYGRPDEVIAAETLANHIRCNNSFVQAVFQAQFRSSLTCPRCKKQSNTFDPFHCISVQLPQLTQQTIFVTVIYHKQHPRQVKLGLTVPAGSPIVALREQLHADTGIASERMVLVDINETGFTRVYYDTQPVSTLAGVETIYCIEVPPEELKKPSSSDIKASNEVANTTTKTIGANTHASTDLLLLVANMRKRKKPQPDEIPTENANIIERFDMPFCLRVPRDATYSELQKKLLREMSSILKPEALAFTTPLSDMFKIRLQDPSADPDTYLEQVEHPLLTEMIDLALSVLSAEAGPAHIKLLLEWPEPELHFADITTTPPLVEHESVARLLEQRTQDTAALTLEQCLEHYTKAETLSAEDAWRCPHCQQYLPVVKTLGLWSLPDILVVHFKRFRQHQAKGSNAAKLTTMVKFPLNAFDMAPHLAKGTRDQLTEAVFSSSVEHYHNRPSPWRKTTRTPDSRSSTLESNKRETRYDLYAVCYHQGDTLETGHYTAACKNPYDHQWYKFDDQRVSRVPSESIEHDIINNEAYMLFYQRRRTDMAECSGSSSTSGEHWVSKIAPPAQTQTVEKAIVAPTNSVVAASAAMTSKVENMPEKAETKPVEIPKVEVVAVEIPLIPKPDELTQDVVIDKTNPCDLADVDVIKYADDGAEDADIDELDILETLTPNNGSSPTTEEANPIFAMDEDCKLNDHDQSSKLTNTPLAPADSSKQQQDTAVSITPVKSKSPLLPAPVTVKTAAANEMIKSPKTVPLTNGNSCSINATPKQNNNTSATVSNSVSASSSSSSLSSRSSPHSLAASTFGASTLQNKFNGFSVSFSSTTAAASNNYKESLLSSSLKSNSSSIIAVATAHANDLHLNQHQYAQHWHGSRSSVSALENVSSASASAHQAPHHTHCLNLRHSFSTSSNFKLKECSDTLSSMLRNSANTCSKDTLIFIDQQNHHHHRHHNHHSLMEDDDDTFMGSRSLWISPVTPHKLITVSPKN